MSEEAWVVLAGGVLYATRPTRAECERVVEEQRDLIAKFGPPKVERRVIPFRPPRTVSS